MELNINNNNNNVKKSEAKVWSLLVIFRRDFRLYRSVNKKIYADESIMYVNN